MNTDPSIVRGRAERIRRLTDSVTFWKTLAIGMTIVAVIVTALSR